MANITVNEVSQNYTYNIGNNSYATVAMPIAACWGPGYFYTTSNREDVLDRVAWRRYPATQQGMEAFVADYRGPESIYKSAKDFSYYQALTYLSTGYDVLVCRVSGGAASSLLYKSANDAAFTVEAKYPGSFGNSLVVTFTRKTYTAITGDVIAYWTAIVYVLDSAGYRSAVENLTFTFDADTATDAIPYIDDLTSAFITIKDIDYAIVASATAITADGTHLDGGYDVRPVGTSGAAAVTAQATARFALAGMAPGNTLVDKYLEALSNVFAAESASSAAKLMAVSARETHFLLAAEVISLLTDKLAYNPDFLVLPGWDDIDFAYLDDLDPSLTPVSDVNLLTDLSPLHAIMMDTAYFSRCATAYIDIPRCATKAQVWNDDVTTPGYAQLLSRHTSANVSQSGPNATLYSTHGGLFVPWGQFRYTGTGKNNLANPVFLGLMIERAMILNQAAQYEWALPSNRRHNLKVGKLDYDVSKKYLDKWQSLEGVGVNIITDIPDMGISLWGNSTLFEVPPATYQALANLSTRKLFNAIEDLVYKVGISITFAYNNDQAYSKFYAGVTPLLDTMKNVGAIDGYYVRMAADINGLDQVNANTVVGKIYLIVNGVINDIVVDLIALPPGSDLSTYM